jgi:hypothetical protein
MLQRLLLLRDVAAGMAFLHSKNIVHSDLVRRAAQQHWQESLSDSCVPCLVLCGSYCVMHSQCLWFSVQPSLQPLPHWW